MPFPTPETVIAEARSLLRLIAVMERHNPSPPGSSARRHLDEARQRVQSIIARNRGATEE